MTSEYPEFVFVAYDGDMTTEDYDISVSLEAGSLVGKPVKYIRHDINTRAVPDVPELVTVAHMREAEITDIDGETYKTFIHASIDKSGAFPVVRRSQAAEIIAAKDGQIVELEADNKRLRDALEPFADIADLIDSETEAMTEAEEFELLFHDYLMANWPVALLRKARAALGDVNHDQ